MKYAWILLGLITLIGLLTKIGSDSTSTHSIKDINDEDDEPWQQQDDPWEDDDIWTDPTYYWMSGNIFYSGDDEQ